MEISMINPSLNIFICENYHAKIAHTGYNKYMYLIKWKGQISEEAIPTPLPTYPPKS